MLELPEAVTLARQCVDTIAGKEIREVVAAHSPHKWAWYHGDPKGYPALLVGKAVETARAVGGLVAMAAGDARILLGDGAQLRYYPEGEKLPKKHQLLVVFADGSALCGSVQMYGGLWCFKEGTYRSKYYEAALEKPTPLSRDFNKGYFNRLITDDVRKKSAKAFLATEQRIPGLGNGVLQDILYEAAIHPKRKVTDLDSGEISALFRSVKATMKEIARLGGRDTEKDLFGRPGGYPTRMSRNTVGKPCSRCGHDVCKESYLGGTVYYCPGCQPLAA